MPLLPGLLFDPKTRVGGECVIYYNLSVGRKVGSIVKTQSGYSYLPETSCAGDDTSPVSGFTAAVVAKPNLGAITVTAGTATPEGVVDPTANNVFPINSPIGMAVELSGTYSDNITDYTGALTGGVVGDQMDIINLPNPANDVLICYDQGFQPSIGRVQKAIPRKFNPADHYVRQRPENKITLKDLVVSSWSGVKRLNGALVVLIAKYYPDGGATPCEIQYYNNVRLTVPPGTSPANANESIEITAEGEFNDFLVFSAKA